MRMLATDLDGTIVFGHPDGSRGIAAPVVHALARWRDAGNLLTVVTGKSVFATREVLDAAQVHVDHVVANTGAVLTDGHYRVTEKHALPTGLVRQVFDLTATLPGVATYATTLDHDYVRHDNSQGRSWILNDFDPLDEAGVDAHEFIGVPLLVEDDAQRDHLQDELTRLLGGRAEVHRNQQFLDIVPAGADKGSGLRRLLDTLTPRLPRRPELWTIGDSWNDIPMHRVADHAVCFDYSPAEVKAACERIVHTADELVDDLLR